MDDRAGRATDRADAARQGADGAVPVTAGQPVRRAPQPSGARLGLVVPKRLARRAVTRNLVKRQARVAFGCHELALPAGDWVLRLRAPLDPRQYRSAASDALRALLREELAGLFARWPVQQPASPASGLPVQERP